VSVQALAQHVDSMVIAHDVACWRVKRLHAARVLRDECGASRPRRQQGRQ
jgi:hypothetical protein